MIVCYGDEIVLLIKYMNFTLGLLCHPTREYAGIPHNMVMKMDIHLACAANLKLI